MNEQAVSSILDFCVPFNNQDTWMCKTASVVSKSWLRLTQQTLQRLAMVVVQRIDAIGPLARRTRPVVAADSPRDDAADADFALEHQRLEVLLVNLGRQYYAHPLTLRISGEHLRPREEPEPVPSPAGPSPASKPSALASHPAAASAGVEPPSGAAPTAPSPSLSFPPPPPPPPPSSSAPLGEAPSSPSRGDLCCNAKTGAGSSDRMSSPSSSSHSSSWGRTVLGRILFWRRGLAS